MLENEFDKQNVPKKKETFWMKYFLQVKAIKWTKDNAVVIVLYRNDAWLILLGQLGRT